jgi:hypothetical protein
MHDEENEILAQSCTFGLREMDSEVLDTLALVLLYFTVMLFVE